MARNNNSGRGYVDEKPSEDEGIHAAGSRQGGPEDDERLDGENRAPPASRTSDTRETATRAISAEERLKTFQRTMFQSALPELPELVGYHVCWLTTNNPRDPIIGRQRLGYELIRADEIPGFDHAALKVGDYSGYIGVNEMVAAKLPLDLYEMYMNEAHHEAPLAEEEKLSAVTQVIAEEARKKSGRMPEIGDGTASLGEGPKRGKFEGATP